MSHVGVLGSIEEIALAKSEILSCLPPDGIAIASGDNEWVRKMSDKAGRPVMSYGLSEGCDVRAVEVKALGAAGSEFRAFVRDSVPLPQSWRGPLAFRLKVPGIHQVHNALAAIAVGLTAGISYEKVRQGLEEAVMSPMRLQVAVTGEGVTIINDAYNASPKSMRSALDLLSETGRGRKIAVLGDMLVMGDYGPPAHREVGSYARSRADYLACSGELAKEIVAGWDATGGAGSSSWFSDKAGLQAFLGDFLHAGDTCLIKASRGMGFESVVASLSGVAEVGHFGH
jgi:UDP-N-acetylmuramoyl-tripeptide--D-alanyl-D-alanine ligase